MLKIKPILSGFKLKFFETINKRITNDPINLINSYLEQNKQYRIGLLPSIRLAKLADTTLDKMIVNKCSGMNVPFLI